MTKTRDIGDDGESLADMWVRVEAAAPEHRAAIIEAWLAPFPKDLQRLMRPAIYSGLTLLETEVIEV